MKAFTQNDIKQVIWGIILLSYTFMLMFVGRFEAYKSLVTKGLTPLLLIIVIIIFKNPISKIPKEFYVYIALAIWSILTVVKVIDFSYYFRYLQLYLGCTMLLFIVYNLVTRYDIAKYFHIGCVLSGVCLLYDAYVNFNLLEIVNQETTARLEGTVGKANMLGSILLMCALSNYYLFVINKGILIRLILFAIQGAILIGIVATGSRSSLIAYVIIFVLGALGYLYLNKRYVLLIAIGTVLFFSISIGYVYVYENTNLGNRIQRVEDGNDGSTKERVKLIYEGGIMIKNNPLMGVGLGNFTANSSEGYFAHNDYLEITATLGIIGLLIYLYYWFCIAARIHLLLRLQLTINDKLKLLLVVLGIINYYITGIFKPLFIDLFFMFYMSILFAETQRLKYAYLSNH